VSIDIASTSRDPNALGALVLCEQKCHKQAPESIFGGVWIMDRIRKTVPGGRTNNGKSPAAVRFQSMTWYVQ